MAIAPGDNRTQDLENCSQCNLHNVVLKNSARQQPVFFQGKVSQSTSSPRENNNDK